MKAQKVKRLFAALIHFIKCFDAAAGGRLNCKPRFWFARVRIMLIYDRRVIEIPHNQIVVHEA